MNMPRNFLVIACLTFAACERQKVETDNSTPPIVKERPVVTLPVESGFDAGFAAGKAAAKPRADIPSEESVEAIAAEQAAADPKRDATWRGAFTQGYLDGFTRVAKGLK